MEEEIVLMEENDIEEINIEEENYSGKPYVLPIASKDVLGGIKVGKNLEIEEDGTLNAQTGGGSIEEKQMMTIKLSEECYLNVETAWKRYGLPLHTILSNMGDAFSLTSAGRIKVGKGVSKISMIASSLALRYENIGECDIGIIIYRNGSTPFQTASYKYYAKTYTFETINLIVPLIDVQENDEIELSMTSALSDRFRLSEAATYLSVKKEA
jgi:hypothetical protein